MVLQSQIPLKILTDSVRLHVNAFFYPFFFFFFVNLSLNMRDHMLVSCGSIYSMVNLSIFRMEMDNK
jgi:hypothetical protein